ncbi:class I SAM-dependent methyltransferase [Methylobacterium dankookense]|uniref:Putative S-adenosylmethionine-dependent methyltransferase/MSMEI_2290 n=1 Tax=Methylobacterium dankookense TaxID=560405 RepID=A0A564G1T3_9HYPH|nr:methyltransferase domain-containing protein [Methylobacterium dankookense]GJD54668.1 Ubiquinone biosynthesis O-methyltransferase, mitochondrial [Methylobacterium dankookense]VUF14439.1 putative S-adenosylmethionine-dependent methyltransferase/MSMEI_2290 [Methylobacterium dankookense]
MRLLDWTNYQELYDKYRDISLPSRIDFDKNLFESRKTTYSDYEGTRDLNSYDNFHGERFRTTVAIYWDYVKKCSEIIELGGLSRIGKFFEQEFNANFSSYENDLRKPFELPSESYDCVLCLEVIEHLKDAPASETDIERIGHFNYSGILNAFDEAYRILRPGGVLVLTTPNANSLGTIIRTAWGAPSFLYELHVRELSAEQVKNFALSAGFQMEMFETFECYHIADENHYNAIRRLLQEVGCTTDRRDNCAFYLLRKPEVSKSAV